MTGTPSSFRFEMFLNDQDIKDLDAYQKMPVSHFIETDIYCTQPECSFWINEHKVYEYSDYLFDFLGFHLAEIKNKGHYDQIHCDGPGILVRVTRPRKGVLQLIFLPEFSAIKLSKADIIQGPHLIEEEKFYREIMKAADKLLWTMKQHYPRLMEIDMFKNLDAKIEEFSRMSGIPRKKSWLPTKHKNKSR